MAVKRKPPAEVLRVSSVFLETKGAIVTHENVDAVVAFRIAEGGYNSIGHERSGDVRAKFTRALHESVYDAFEPVKVPS